MNNTSAAPHPATILIVDDLPENLEILQHFLTEQGHTVRAAPNGERALTFAQATPPDLILLDIRMPGMDGYEVCERLKADDRTRGIPVLFLSALDEVHDKVNAFAVGGVDYITKPFHAKEVLARVTTHLTLRRLQQHLEALVDERTAELRAALARQTILLSEVHHRTRNNMAVMCGLIDLHARQIEDDAVRKTFQDLQARIHAMALVHEQLHQPDLTFVNLQAYIPQLAQTLLLTYQIDPERITCTYELAPVTMPVDTAVPFGSVLHELLCNAILHAFPDGRRGAIRIVLQVAEDGYKDLWVHDNGVGLPPDFNGETSDSLGIGLVKLIVAYQLRGTVAFERAAAGATVHVRFNEPQYKQRV